MLKLIICGINGEMGTNVYTNALKMGHEVTCGIDKITVKNIDCPVYTELEQAHHFTNVIVDFSSPSITNDLLNYAITNSVPVVIGTTGHTKTQEEQITNASKIIPIFKSANTSLGVYSFIKICKLAYQTLMGFDVEIIEKHHKKKKDSPSGTANLIKNSMLSNVDSCNKQNIPIHSIRGGTIIGEHNVLFFGNGESISLTHTAESKHLFARGALKACEFIVSKQNGLYSMEDLV